MGYEVLSNELTLHKDVRVLTDQQGNVTGKQLGLGKTYYKGEVIPDEDLASVYKETLDGDKGEEKQEKLERKLKKVSGNKTVTNTAQRLGVPFDGYDDMDEDSVVAAMKHLPSATIQRIKEYETNHGENRSKISMYSVGYGTDPDARQEGRVGSQVAEEGSRDTEPEDKATAKLTTREVTDEGVTHGDGVTGTGEGKIPYGSQKESDSDDKPKATQRRSRRTRATS